MPGCRQCGKQNPEGTVFCGYCASPLSRPIGSANPVASTPVREPKPKSSSPNLSPAKPFKPEIRLQSVQTAAPPPPAPPVKKGIEWIPWSELSPAQRAGRSTAAAVVVLLLFFFLRGILRGIGSSNNTGYSGAPAADISEAPITEGDRKDGIESLCKVFQIYGMPKNDKDGAEAARNAAELYKLSGNQTPTRSIYILTTIAQEFRAGKLKEPDCAEAGAPVGSVDNSTQENTTDQNSLPDINR